jgi:hypothetical protein
MTVGILVVLVLVWGLGIGGLLAKAFVDKSATSVLLPTAFWLLVGLLSFTGAAFSTRDRFMLCALALTAAYMFFQARHHLYLIEKSTKTGRPTDT